MEINNEEMLTTDEVSKRWKIDKRTQKEYRDRNVDPLPYTRPGKRILYRKCVLEAWIDKFEVKSRAVKNED